jgi:integrase
MATENITAGAIQSLTYDPNGPSRQVLWDRKVSGFGVRVSPNDKYAYILKYRTAGRTRLMTLGRVDDFTNVGQARDKASEDLRRLRRDKVDPLDERQREQTAGTLKEMLGMWLDHIARKRSPRTLADYRGYVNSYLVPEIGTRRPADLTRGDCRRLHAKFTDRNGLVQANRVMQGLRASYGWVLKSDSDTLPQNFTNPVVLEFNREKVRREHVKPAELRSVTLAMDGEPDPFARAFFWLLLLTGARSGEVLGLRWTDVDLEAGELQLDKTKNGTNFTMKLSAAAMEVFRAVPKISNSDYVFPPQRSDGGLHMVPPRKQWRAVLARAGITRRITLHDLRRSVGVLLSTRGYTAEQIARQLNHKSNVTAKIYVVIADEIQQEMANTLATAATAPTVPTGGNNVIPLRSRVERMRTSSRARR